MTNEKLKEEFDNHFPDVLKHEMEEIYSGIFSSTGNTIDISKEIANFWLAKIDEIRDESKIKGERNRLILQVRQEGYTQGRADEAKTCEGCKIQGGEFMEDAIKEARLSALKEAKKEVEKLIGLYGTPNCGFLSHKKHQYHKSICECPVVKEIEESRQAIQSLMEK